MSKQIGRTVTCIGGANVDRKAVAEQPLEPRTSNPVQIGESAGGVARNVGENLVRLGVQTSLITVVGDDAEGSWLLGDARRSGLDTHHAIMLPDQRTGAYIAVLEPDGEMHIALADMTIYDRITWPMIRDHWRAISTSACIFADTNLPADVLESLIREAAKFKIPLVIDPVSTIKARKLPKDLTGVFMLLPNREEAEELSGVAIESADDYGKATAALMEKGVEEVAMTLGPEGAFAAVDSETRFFESTPVEVVDVTGAGDAFTAGMIFGLIEGVPFFDSARMAMRAAHLAIQSRETVSPDLNREILLAESTQQT